MTGVRRPPRHTQSRPNHPPPVNMSSLLRRKRADPRHSKLPLGKRAEDTDDTCRCLCQCSKCVTSSEESDSSGDDISDVEGAATEKLWARRPRPDESETDTSDDEPTDEEPGEPDKSEDAENVEDYCAELDELRGHLHLLYPDSDSGSSDDEN